MIYKKNRQIYYVLIVFSLLLSSCTPQANAAPISTQSISAASPTGVSMDGPRGLQVGAAVPVSLREQAQGWNVPTNSFLSLDVSNSTTPPIATRIPWVYVLVAPFPTLTDGFSADELKNAWL